MVEKLEKKLDKEKLKDFEHLFNPQHLYCRLLEVGFTRRQARAHMELYEANVYRPLMMQLNKYYKTHGS